MSAVTMVRPAPREQSSASLAAEHRARVYEWECRIDTEQMCVELAENAEAFEQALRTDNIATVGSFVLGLRHLLAERMARWEEEA